MVGQLVEWLEEAIKGKIEAEKPKPAPKRKEIGVDTLQYVCNSLFIDPNFSVETYVDPVEDRYTIRVYHRPSKICGKTFLRSIDLIVDPVGALRRMVDEVKRLQDDIAAEALWAPEIARRCDL